MIRNINKDTLSDYRTFLQMFLERGYQFKSFSDVLREKENIILRHDIDFSTDYALKAALIEADLGISSTFFFLIRSEFYNVLSPKNYDNINKIKDLGHDISIHFDPTLYDDFELGLKKERQDFRNLFNVEINTISLHRPSKFFLECNELIDGLKHTYLPEYFQSLKYFADSTGVWRFGHPIHSEEVLNMKSLQILIHPIWWFIKAESNIKKLEVFWYEFTLGIERQFSENSIPFRNNLGGISSPKGA